MPFLDKSPRDWGGNETHNCAHSLSQRLLPSFIHMSLSLILASQSAIRAHLLRNAGLVVETRPARIDEEMIRHALEAEGATPRDVAHLVTFTYGFSF